MMASSNNIEMYSIDTLRSTLEDKSDGILSVNPDEEVTEALIEVLGNLSDPPQVRLLAQERVLKWVRGNFAVASAAAELIEAETLSLRATDKRPMDSLILTRGTVVSLVSVGKQIAGLMTDDKEFIQKTQTHWNSVWETAKEFELRMPARSCIKNSLTAEFGPEINSDFRTMIDALRTARSNDRNGDSDGLGEVGVSLLVAAKHNELFYDISNWAEDLGVASKATFSRTKAQFEEQGLIETEKVPIDVGRPRQRLLLSDDQLRDGDAEEIVSAVHGSLTRTLR